MAGCGEPPPEDPAATATVAEALNTCTWKSPYDNKTYSNVQVRSHGGPVRSLPSLVLDFWGSYAALITPIPRPRDVIPADLNAMISDLAFWARYKQYGVLGGSVNPTRILSNGSLGGKGTVTKPLVLTDAQIRTMIETDVKTTGAAKFSGRNIIVVLLPPELRSSRNKTGVADSQGFGYHDAYFSSTLNANLPYAIINTFDPASNEAGNTVTMAHEIMEAASDPFYNTNPATPAYLSDVPTQSQVGAGVGGATPEIGDLCNGMRAWFGPPTAPVFGQQSWLQNQCRCDSEHFDLPASGCGTIASSRALRVNMKFFSCSGRFALQLQGDGNLVLVDYGVTPAHALWASNTDGSTGNVADFQGDGNFVLYDGDGNALWATGTNGSANGGAVRVQDDGNLVVVDASGRTVWATNTHP